VTETEITALHFAFLQRVIIACYAERCISSYNTFRPSVCQSQPGIMSK